MPIVTFAVCCCNYISILQFLYPINVPLLKKKPFHAFIWFIWKIMPFPPKKRNISFSLCEKYSFLINFFPSPNQSCIEIIINTYFIDPFNRKMTLAFSDFNRQKSNLVNLAEVWENGKFNSRCRESKPFNVVQTNELRRCIITSEYHSSLWGIIWCASTVQKCDWINHGVWGKNCFAMAGYQRTTKTNAHANGCIKKNETPFIFVLNKG